MKAYFIVFIIFSLALLVQSQSFQDPHRGPEIFNNPVEIRRPYSFAWSASRHYNGNPDREHREERGEDGITRGVFRYIDPRNQIQEVIYVADEFGFHVDASNLPQDTKVVKAAKLRHKTLFDRIAAEHAQIAIERQQIHEGVQHF